jgi:hypothetical protein
MVDLFRFDGVAIPVEGVAVSVNDGAVPNDGQVFQQIDLIHWCGGAAVAL